MRRAALAVLLAMPSAAMAQDYDSRWIGETIRRSLHDSDKPRVYRTPREHYRAPEPRREREHREPEIHPGTRVHGIMTHSQQRIQRDVLSNVICMPPIESLSVEANTEEGAWKDAQRNWENLVRWKYGERFMAIGNAASVTKQCSRSSGNQSVAGRVAENVATVLGQDGYKHRCQIVASACMAPQEQGPNVKGDSKQ
jgi:hypothetical protein